MARYTGPKSKIARKFREPIFGPDKALEKKNYPPGQHGNTKKKGKKSEYAIQLMEKQKAKYTYGILEKQFRNYFRKRASTLLAFSEFPVALCKSAMALLSSVWARSSLLREFISAVCRSKTL